MAEVIIKSYKAERLKEITDSLEKKMGQVGAIVERQAKINTLHPMPSGKYHTDYKDTSRLSSSIMHRVLVGKDEIAVEIGSKVYYGIFLEHGTINMPPYPWLFPAVEMSRDRIVELLGEKVGVEETGAYIFGEF